MMVLVRVGLSAVPVIAVRVLVVLIVHMGVLVRDGFVHMLVFVMFSDV